MKYPNGYFRPKQCRTCSKSFLPQAPSHHYCSDECKGTGKRNAYYLRVYGITFEDHQQLLEQQNSKCALCGSLGFLIGTKGHTELLAVDHDHSTGKVRGLLCHNCNRGLGLFQDNVAVLRKAADYVEANREGATTRAKARRPQADGGRSAKPRDAGDDIVCSAR